MSLRILIKPDQIEGWIAERKGTPARKKGSDSELQVLFEDEQGAFERISVDELIETIKFHRIVMMVDEEAGKTFHKFIQHS